MYEHTSPEHAYIDMFKSFKNVPSFVGLVYWTEEQNRAGPYWDSPMDQWPIEKDPHVVTVAAIG